MSNNLNVLLVGAGYMGKEYCKVLKAQGIPFTVYTRSQSTAELFKKETGIKAEYGDFNILLEREEYTHAINAVNVEHLIEVTETLLNKGIKKILVEKPLGLTVDSTSRLNELVEKYYAAVYVAYNRRYYASTTKAFEIIKNDGGLKSIQFEFTEWKTKIDFSVFSKDVQEKWLHANSSHVIDLAFFLAGEPDNYVFYSGRNSNGQKDVFVGSGITKNKVFFSYSSNWDAPGRWGIELMTDKHRIYLRPMEKVSIQELNSVMITELSIDDKLDIEYKPGIYLEVKDFLSDKPTNKLKTIKEQVESIKLYDEMLYGCDKTNNV